MYFSERGIKTTNEVFDTEESACQFIFEQFCVESFEGKNKWKVFKDSLSRKGNYILTLAYMDNILKNGLNKISYIPANKHPFDRKV